MPIRTPFQGDFLVRVVPRAEALYLFSAINTCSGHEPRMLSGRYTQSGTGVPPVSDETEETGGTPVPLFQPLNQDGLP